MSVTVDASCMYSFEKHGSLEEEDDDRTSVRPYTGLRSGSHGSQRGVLIVLSVLPWGSWVKMWPARKPSATMWPTAREIRDDGRAGVSGGQLGERDREVLERGTGQAQVRARVTGILEYDDQEPSRSGADGTGRTPVGGEYGIWA
ncbi:hypothetical protein GLAREA_03122 [Glarea lozoyensis ATCC 20868]|uniref:Uncharacterized protein n=1 Tax=Glarea lozoyensis (strain ATCC 20868 / MF5171) TaxID=1116229 RepID=S3DKX6_GLAL2|nr:uncharacterized protein GLAREA_03122 [Glarea lozoyensis ATCC 20868]EPE27208.1 hypothetical protein GLAREA_03122 [Glarea lozoyensis ATCC 20868]